MKDYQELKKHLIHLNNRYHIDDVSVVSDAEYDKMLVQLKTMEKKQGFADSDSPTQCIGATIIHGRKVKHSEKMYSLDNVFSNNELNSFFAKYPDETYCCEAKIDGMSGEIVYKDGKLMIASTRGDGYIGENITENVLMVSNVPKEISEKEIVEIRGEFAIHKKDFEEINRLRVEAGLDPFKTPRNLAAGTMRGLNPNDVVDRFIKFYAYGTTNWKDEDYLSRRKKIEKMGFQYLPTLIIDGLEKVEIIVQSIKDAEEHYDFEMDGVVVKLNSATIQASLGYTSKDPRWAVARKWNSEFVVTELLDIEHQVGRTGVITPVAKVAPVEIGRVTVTSATLHNHEEIQRLGLVKGCKVRLVRSGEVIPKIEGIYFDDANNATVTELFSPPTKCPHCEYPVEQIGVKLYCSNQYCHGQIKAQLIYFASKIAMNIVDMDEATVTQLLLKGFVRTYADFYRLTKRNILALDGFADKSAEKLLANIENSKHPTLEKFIVALGIPNVAQATAKSLAKRFHSIENLRKADTFSLIDIEDIGDKTAEEIKRFFQNDSNIKIIDDLLQYVTPTYTVNSIGNELEGKTFVITGSFEVDRKEIGRILEAYGAKVSGSVSSKTTLLIMGENPGDNKVKDADKYGIWKAHCSGKSLSLLIDFIFEMLNVPKPNQPF